MDRQTLLALIKKNKERRAALLAQSDKSEDANELRSLSAQIKTLTETIDELRATQDQLEAEERAAAKAAADAAALEAAKAAAEKQTISERTQIVNAAGAEMRDAGVPAFTPGKGFSATEERTANGRFDVEKIVEERTAAGAELKEKNAVKSNIGLVGELRSVSVGDGSNIIIPKHFSSNINPDFAVVSSLIDGVNHLSLPGGESFREAYITEIETGGYTAEGADPTNAETKFAYADINRAKITAYNEITEELMKLPNAPYADVVFSNVRTSMRMLISKEILVGAGGTNQLIGIFSDKAKAIDAATDLELSTIDDTTLDEIIFSYGGQEEVEGIEALILSKADLLAFSKVRTATKEKFYTIVARGNTGTINGVPYIINSACKPLTAAATVSTAAAPAYCMCYGNLQNYKLVEFSDMEIKRSEDYKFKQGMIAHRGVIMAGGNVIRKNGFLRIKKAITA